MSRRKLAKAKAKRASKARAAQAAKHEALEAKAMLLVAKPKSRLRRMFSLKGLREGLLTFGAIAGVFCMLLAVAAFAFDIKPVIFRSGSMSPTIDTGALAISHTVKANNLAVGDIVTVKTGSGVRVTHRIQNVTLANGKATLILKGDANKVVDEHAYVVKSADRVLFDIPRAGYVVSWLSGPIGIFAGGLLAGLLVLTAFGPGTRNQRKPGTRKLFGVSVATLTLGLISTGIGGSTNTQAYYADTAAAVSGTFSRAAIVVQPPVAPVITSCTVSNGNSDTTIAWTEAVNPTTFEVHYLTGGNANQSFPGNVRSGQLSASLNNTSGTFVLVAIGPGGTSANSNVYAYSGNGGNRKCQPAP